MHFFKPIETFSKHTRIYNRDKAFQLPKSNESNRKQII
jgi:hypothetical protein